MGEECFELPNKNKFKRKRQRSDEIFRFTGFIPSERRKSERLSNVKPKYSYTDLEKVEGFADFENEDKDPVSSFFIFYCSLK